MNPNNQQVLFANANESLLKEVVLQMEKDLEMSGNKHQFISSNPAELIIELKKVLAVIDNIGKMQSLLYRIDLNINKMEIGEDFYHSLSLFVWDRILQKVWFRKQFGG